MAAKTVMNPETTIILAFVGFSSSVSAIFVHSNPPIAIRVAIIPKVIAKHVKTRATANNAGKPLIRGIYTIITAIKLEIIFKNYFLNIEKNQPIKLLRFLSYQKF